MRPSKDETFLEVAFVLAGRSTCKRRKVGAVLVDERGHVLATGYNGVASGDVHCIDSPCLGADLPSGQGLDKCEAIHAEQNALAQCSDAWAIHTVYVTCAPCIHCLKMLKNTSAVNIIFRDPYPGWESNRDYWERENLERVKHGLPRREFIMKGQHARNGITTKWQDGLL